MSASAKKKLRKEQKAALLTERQQKERAEAKKLKRNTILFVSIIAVVLVIAIVTMVTGLVTRSGIIEKNTVAANVDGKNLNTVEMNYYYYDAVTNTYNQWANQFGDYMQFYMQMMGLDLTKSLNSQVYDAETGETWADYFLNVALSNAQGDFALYNLAVEEGFTLSSEEQLNLDSSMDLLELYSSAYNYPSVNDYLVSIYGYGADLDSYREYKTRNAIANAYYSQKYNSMSYDDAQIQAYLDEHPEDFTSYTFNTYYVRVDDYLVKGKETYTDEEWAKAREAARKNSIALGIHHTTEDLDAAIAGLYVNKDKTDAKSTPYTNTLYTQLSEFYKDWLADPARVAGDITCIPNETTTTAEDGTETTEISGYYIVLFHSRNDNNGPMSDVRHLLVQFEGGTTVDGETVYSEEEKAAALKEAEELLAQWEAGEKTEDSFAALVKEKTDDTASAESGGLYTGVHAGSNYMEGFLNWAIDPERAVGDTGIVETPYGYHIMFCSRVYEESYRDQMITNLLLTDDMNAWYTAAVEAVTATLADTSRMNKDLVLAKAQ